MSFLRDTVTLDFETYYDKFYSLTKMPQDEYICDPRFETLGCSIAVGDSPPKFYYPDNLREILWGLRLGEKTVLCHHAQFDLAILHWHYGITPGGILCTMSMGRKLKGVGGLAKLAALYHMPPKGDAIIHTMGKRLGEFTGLERVKMAEYANHDVSLTRSLCECIIPHIDPSDLRCIDTVVRMFTEPKFIFDTKVLNDHLASVESSMDDLIERVASAFPPDTDIMKVVRSPVKFTEFLEAQGVTPPMAYSEAKMKITPCYNKTFQPFLDLLEHEKPLVRDAVALKLRGNSNLDRTRAKKFLATAESPRLAGKAPIYLSYWGAHTGRFSGGSGANWQNLPRNGQLRRSLCAPEGHTMLTVDASQIECRLAAWLCRENKLLDVFRRGDDPYCDFGRTVYGRDITKADKAERFVSKVAVLGLQYNMGPERFQHHVGQGGQHISEEEAERVVGIYRRKHYGITSMWKRLGRALESAANGRGMKVHELVGVYPDGIHIDPGRIKIRYKNLRKEAVEDEDSHFNTEFFYDDVRGRKVKIYGGKMLENIIQTLAALYIRQKMNDFRRGKLRPLLQVHDEIVFAVPYTDEKRVARVVELVTAMMAFAPEWCQDVPLGAEVGTGRNFLEAGDK